MKLQNSVLYAIEDGERARTDAALLHALTAIDGTSKRLYPSLTGVGARFTKCLREYYWLIEPMIGAGINLVETRFENVKLKRSEAPDFADIIYEVFRCGHAHGEEISSSFDLRITKGPYDSTWRMGHNSIHMPDRLLWALIGVAVFSRANYRERTTTEHYLTLAEEKFLVREWWGRESDLKVICEKYNKVRVKLEGLGGLLPPSPDHVEEEQSIVIYNPPFI